MTIPVPQNISWQHVGGNNASIETYRERREMKCGKQISNPI
jgi:hypothetical protein